ncbi:MAG: site-specific integrase, partial [Bacteroidales bacterium]|nr:site-specific integrase [Bacteroidales bacterium]
MASYQKRQTRKGTVWDIVYWTTEDGERVQKRMCGYSSKQAAQEDYERLKVSPDILAAPTKASVSLKEAGEDYIESNKEIFAPATVYQYQKYLRMYILPYLSSKKIEDITRSDIVRWQETIWNMKTKKGELMKQETCKSIRKFFNGLMNWSVKMYFLNTNPFDGVKMPRRRETKTEMQVWTTEEFNRFLSQVPKTHYKIFFTLLFLTGCRIGEIDALTVDDFIKDNDRYSIKITKSIGWVTGKGAVVSPPKTESSVRTVSLPAGMTAVLDNFLEGKSGYLWNRRKRDFWQVFDIATKNAKLKHIRIHDLRHSHASILISSGIPVSTVSKRL